MTDQPVVGVILVCPNCGEDFVVSAARAKKEGMAFCKQRCWTDYRKTHPVVKRHVPKYARGRKRQGFASFSEEKLAEVCKRGGQSSQSSGKGYRWTKEAATQASVKGAAARARKRVLKLMKPEEKS